MSAPEAPLGSTRTTAPADVPDPLDKVALKALGKNALAGVIIGKARALAGDVDLDVQRDHDAQDFTGGGAVRAGAAA